MVNFQVIVIENKNCKNYYDLNSELNKKKSLQKFKIVSIINVNITNIV